MLKVFGWIFVPYLMLPFQWKKLNNRKRFLALTWIAVIFIVAVGNFVSDDSSEPMTASPAITEAENVESTGKDQALSKAKNENIDATGTREHSTTEPISPVLQEPKLHEDKDLETIPKSNLEYDVILYFPADKYPETASHIQSAIAKGESPVCTIDRDGADENRKESLDDVPVKEGYDRDEWPMAFCEEGGERADVAYIDPSDNRGAGSWVGNQLEDFPDGTRVLFVVSDDEDGIEVVNAKIKEKIPMSSVSEIAATKKVEEDKQVKPSSKGKAETVYYANCTEVRNAGVAPLYEGEPGYSRKLDRDGDGVACE